MVTLMSRLWLFVISCLFDLIEVEVAKDGSEQGEDCVGETAEVLNLCLKQVWHVISTFVWNIVKWRKCDINICHQIVKVWYQPCLKHCQKEKAWHQSLLETSSICESMTSTQPFFETFIVKLRKCDIRGINLVWNIVKRWKCELNLWIDWNIVKWWMCDIDLCVKYH